MFDIGWVELFVIGSITLLVVGPTDIPRVFRAVMQALGKMRSLAYGFRASIDDMVREAELDEVKKTITETVPDDLNSDIQNMIDPDGKLQASFEEIKTQEYNTEHQAEVNGTNPNGKVSNSDNDDLTSQSSSPTLSAENSTKNRTKT